MAETKPAVAPALAGDAAGPVPTGPQWDLFLAGPGETPHSTGIAPDWDKILGEEPKPPPDWNALDALANGLVLGSGPYIRAAGRSARQGFKPGSYAAELAKAKADQASYAADNPITSGALGIIGSMPAVGLATAASPEISVPAAFGKAAPLLGRVASWGLRGGEAGAMQTGVTGGDVGTNALTGAGIGGAFPVVGAVASKAFKPVLDAGVATAAEAAQKLGFTSLRPGQYAMPGWVTRADKSLMSGQDVPQLKQYTRILSHSIGEDTESLTPEVLEKAQARIGKGLDTVAANTKMVYDPTLHKRLNDILYDVTSASGVSKADKAAVRNVIEDIRNSAAFTPARKSGKAFQQLTQYGSMLGELSQSRVPTVRQAGGDISDALFETVARYSPSDQTKALFDLKDQYRNVLALRKPVAKAGPSGLLDPKIIANLTAGSPAVKTMASVSKYLPSPAPSGAAKTAPGRFGLSAIKVGAAAGLASDAKEHAAWAAAHPLLTTAIAAATISALGTRPVIRSALGSAWLNKLALGQSSSLVNPLVPSTALAGTTGVVNQQ